jgi:branched-chain amino acid transport system permease protein
VRACAINLQAARLMGVDTGKLTLAVFAVAGAAGAAAGVVIAPIVLANWDAGIGYGLKGFIGAILGNFRSPGIAVLGGLGIGIVESFAAGYVSSGFKDAIVYGVLLAYLLVRGGVFAFGRTALKS